MRTLFLALLMSLPLVACAGTDVKTDPVTGRSYVVDAQGNEVPIAETAGGVAGLFGIPGLAPAVSSVVAAVIAAAAARKS